MKNRDHNYDPGIAGVTHEIIRDTQWNNAVARAEKSALKAYGHTWTRATISNNCGAFIVEVRHDDLLVVKPGWRKAIKDFAATIKQEKKEGVSC